MNLNITNRGIDTNCGIDTNRGIEFLQSSPRYQTTIRERVHH